MVASIYLTLPASSRTLPRIYFSLNRATNSEFDYPCASYEYGRILWYHWCDRIDSACLIGYCDRLQDALLGSFGARHPEGFGMVFDASHKFLKSDILNKHKENINLNFNLDTWLYCLKDPHLQELFIRLCTKPRGEWAHAINQESGTLLVGDIHGSELFLDRVGEAYRYAQQLRKAQTPRSAKRRLIESNLNSRLFFVFIFFFVRPGSIGLRIETFALIRFLLVFCSHCAFIFILPSFFGYRNTMKQNVFFLLIQSCARTTPPSKRRATSAMRTKGRWNFRAERRPRLPFQISCKWAVVGLAWDGKAKSTRAAISN